MGSIGSGLLEKSATRCRLPVLILQAQRISVAQSLKIEDIDDYPHAFFRVPRIRMPLSEADNPLKIKLETKLTILDIELLLDRISASPSKLIEIWLGRALGPNLFKDSRVVCLLALPCFRQAELDIDIYGGGSCDPLQEERARAQTNVYATS
jgi:hypothetical protein